ncbi:hypothetical protein SAMN05444161_4137 [Rhizobiales bacterium GAS191]|nr:hypothetical protein SAMN05444161_4137 [Rhizobiales bacterium GAS191]
MAWDQEAERPGRADSCPYDRQEIRQYLDSCHNHFVAREPPTSYSVGDLVLEHRGSERSYWLFEATDTEHRRWYVLVGSGLSPFDKRKCLWRWMYAEANDLDEEPKVWFAHAHSEQIAHDLRIRS